MFEEFNLSPYSGLRSFTEDESIFFKGRDDQSIEITRLLEKNKFLMVTGASGDGKSSLVFAGLIPNARAGFFRSKYNQWLIADFRPERNPLKNFAGAISRELGKSPDTVETEISRGYSSLVDLYTDSEFYSEDSKNGANLLILVDQFEEFFTNPENYANSVPSTESQNVVNVLLETAKIALEKDLPVYIVCTMRSDYIGQCAAFRGLPEYIGFSQFFVPRLKRKQLQQVIEEPAELNGNNISRRLTERLIYDLEEGVDQLPILQHALTQIWITAGNGTEEMDLIHYAMVGGINASELPTEDQDRYENWIKSQPEFVKESLQNPSLNNILDIHSNKLYEDSARSFNEENTDSPITIQKAKRAIAMTFACLTKIDHSRAVRNRMTLGEITKIINDPELDEQRVSMILKPFRDEGNTFIKPYLNDLEHLDSGTVLDITHESLIRNWRKLRVWADKEFEYYETYLDLNKQVVRWVNNGKSRAFLLPIGPLSYYENWYENCNPNQYWVGRYQASDNTEKRWQDSVAILKALQEFLRKSAQKHLVSRAFIKYGARNIAIIFGLVVTLVLSGFYYADAVSKINENVITRIYEYAADGVSTDENIQDFEYGKSKWLLSTLRHNPSLTFQSLDTLSPASLDMKLGVSLSLYTELISIERKFKGEEKNKLIALIDADLEAAKSDSTINWRTLNDHYNEFLANLTLDWYFNNEKYTREVLDRNLLRTKASVFRLLDNKPQGQYGIAKSLIFSVEYLLNHRALTINEVDRLINTLDDRINNSLFYRYFRNGSFLDNGTTSPLSNLPNEGGFQLMAKLYSVKGDFVSAVAYMNKNLEQTSKSIYRNSLQSFSNHTELVGYALKNEFEANSIQEFVTAIATSLDIQKLQIYKDILDRSGYIHPFYSTNFGSQVNVRNGRVNPIMELLSPQELNALYNLYESEVMKIDDNDERNFELALLNKNRAIITYRYYSDRNLETFPEYYNTVFEKSINYFKEVSQEYANGTSRLLYQYYNGGWRSKDIPRSYQFFYPDIFATGYYSRRYTSDVFAEYLLARPDLGELTGGYVIDLNIFNDWVSAGFELPLNYEFEFRLKWVVAELKTSTVELVWERLKGFSEFDPNLTSLILAPTKFNNERSSFRDIGELVTIENIEASASVGEYLNYTFFFNQVVNLAKHYALDNNHLKSIQLLESIKEIQFETLAYIEVSNAVYLSEDPALSFTYLDSAFSKLSRFNWRSVNEGFEIPLSIVKNHYLIGGTRLEDRAQEELIEGYPDSYYSRIMGLMLSGQYDRAYNAMPDGNTFSEVLNTLSWFTAWEGKTIDDDRWTTYDAVLDRYVFNKYIVFEGI